MGRGGMRGGFRSKTKNRQGNFDPNDERYVKHSKIGVWDYYEEIDPRLTPVPGSSWIQACYDIYKGLPYLWRMIQDILSIPACRILLPVYIVLQGISAMLPGLTLWYSAQMLHIVQTAVDERKVDTDHLIHIALGRLGCASVTRLLAICTSRIRIPIDYRIKQYYSVHIFEAMSRLDVPTFGDKGVQRQLEQSQSNSSSSVAAETLQSIIHIFNTILHIGCQTSVLYSVLREQRDGTLMTALAISGLMLQWAESSKRHQPRKVWAATTSDETFIRMTGMKLTVSAPEHHKEIVAGGLQEYLLSQYRQAIDTIGNKATDFMEVLVLKRTSTSLWSFLYDPLRELPKIIITFRAIQAPAHVPISLASLNLVTETTNSFTRQIRDLIESTNSIAYHIDRVYGLYQLTKIPNKVENGTTPFPGNAQSLLLGISIEFRNVSFVYPGSDSHALQNVSFKIEQGQLCVIVGANGSGKSTILKLVSRVYDPVEGEILLNGIDIKRYKLQDLRRAMSVLFQDFTIFPLSIKDNIGLGDPDNAFDVDSIRQAARLGGAEEFIDRLPDGFDTYLERPVSDQSSGLPSGTTTIFGKPVEHGRIMNGMDAYNQSLSGGQMQRIALARSFMRSHLAESNVGLLLFDEPSASLDPATEHDLFQRLRQLRGNKTMIFSSHRFGNLTRHADLILFMHDAAIVETGSHDQLLKSGGEYARLWKLQAEAFLA